MFLCVSVSLITSPEKDGIRFQFLFLPSCYSRLYQRTATQMFSQFKHWYVPLQATISVLHKGNDQQKQSPKTILTL